MTPMRNLTFSGLRRPALAVLYLDWFRTVWGANEVPPRRLFAAFFAGLALICGATALMGAVPTRLFGHDIFFLLDNGWRVINGQRPHVDYYSPWGPVTFLITAAGLEISGNSVNGIGYGNALAAFIMGSWTFYVAKNRLTPSLRLLLSFLLAVLVAAPYPLGYSPFLSSHAMVYNRYGYALLGVIVLETFRSSGGDGQDAGEEWIGGISTGIALSLTLFLKASFFLVAVAVVVILSAFFRRLAVRRIAGLCLGGFLAALGMLAYLHFDALAMLSDLRMAAGARTESLDPRTPLFDFLNHAGFLLGVLAFCKATAVVLGDRVPEASPRRSVLLFRRHCSHVEQHAIRWLPDMLCFRDHGAEQNHGSAEDNSSSAGAARTLVPGRAMHRAAVMCAAIRVGPGRIRIWSVEQSATFFLDSAALHGAQLEAAASVPNRGIFCSQ
jgi:hypothetical protein